MDAAAVRQGAVLALLPAEAAAAELPRRAEAAAVELSRRAEAAVVVELPRRAEAELPRRAEAAVVELPRRAEAAYQRRRYPRCPVTARQEACDRGAASRCWLRGRLLRP